MSGTIEIEISVNISTFRSKLRTMVSDNKRRQLYRASTSNWVRAITTWKEPLPGSDAWKDRLQPSTFVICNLESKIHGQGSREQDALQEITRSRRFNYKMHWKRLLDQEDSTHAIDVVSKLQVENLTGIEYPQ